MVVNKIKIRLDNKVSGDTYVNIPIKLSSTPIGQHDAQHTQIVKDEVLRDINPIVDYERFPYEASYYAGLVQHLVYRVEYKLTFINGSRWIDIGFSEDDLRYHKQSLFQSFFEIKLYDSKDMGNRKLIDVIKLYPNKYELANNTNFPLCDVVFSVSSDIIDKSSNNDGYFLYNTKTLENETLYGEMMFFNGKTGKQTRFLTGNGFADPTSVINLNNLRDNMFIKYDFSYNDHGFYYFIRDCITNTFDIQVNVLYNPQRKTHGISGIGKKPKYREGNSIGYVLPTTNPPPSSSINYGIKKVLQVTVFESKVI